MLDRTRTARSSAVTVARLFQVVITAALFSAAVTCACRADDPKQPKGSKEALEKFNKFIQRVEDVKPDEEVVRPGGEFGAPRPNAGEPKRKAEGPVTLERISNTRSALSPEDQKKVNQSIQWGVEYLKSVAPATGSWGGYPSHPLAMAALPGLTLLECGVPPNDPAVQKALAFVRAHAPANNQTYDIGCTLMFLDRLGDRQDEPLIRSLGLRLIAGQTRNGGWTYTCQPVGSQFEPNLLLVLEATRPRNALELFVTKDGKADLEFLGIDKQQQLKLAPDLLGMRFDPDHAFRGVVPGAPAAGPMPGGQLDVKPGIDVKPGENTIERDPILAAQIKAKERDEEEKRKEKMEAAAKARATLPKNLQDIPALLPPSALKNTPRGDASDNSNSQFGILGILAATRHGVPTERTMGFIVQRYRTSQHPDGSFSYHYTPGGAGAGTPAMTGVGLLGLAVTHGLTSDMKLEGFASKGLQDKGIQKGLAALSNSIGKPLTQRKTFGRRAQQAQINLYLMWTIERVGMLYGIAKMNDKDWYQWGVEVLLDAQGENGSWAYGGYPGSNGSPVVDTCFALLFLKRANLAKDLSNKVQNKLELSLDGK